MLGITIDLTYFDPIINAPTPIAAGLTLFKMGGWVVVVILAVMGLWYAWMTWRQNSWASRIEHVLLAIDVPKETEQTPKAVEHIFSTIYGTVAFYDRIEKYWHGKIPPSFSLEIVSIDGYVQFFIRSWSKLRDVVEAAIYAQYPDAEIAEVEDYTKAAPKEFPAEGWDLFGIEFKPFNKSPYPIRTYPEFEDSVSGELKDPIAALLEGLSKLQPGEQLWLQILISPDSGIDVRAEGEGIIKKLIKAKAGGKKNILQEFASDFMGQILPPPEGASSKKEEPPTMMLHLTPGEKKVVESIQLKLGKVMFNSKIRAIYVGRKETFAKARTISTLKGAIGQFTQMDLNGLWANPTVATKSDYIWQRKKIFEYLSLFMYSTFVTRQNTILRAYRSRDMSIGLTPFALNTEELASLYHFPIITVKAPLLKKTEAKRAEPPFKLPVHAPETLVPTIPPPEPKEGARRAPPPAEIPAAEEGSSPGNLPFV